MPDYTLTHDYLDANGGTTSKTYKGTYADYATARTAADTFTAAAIALTNAQMFKETFSEINEFAGAPQAASNVFERISATTSLVGKTTKFNLTIPAPIPTVFAGNNLIFGTANEYDDYVANIAGGGWTVSDGDVVGATITGKRIFRGSGSSNLPA